MLSTYIIMRLGWVLSNLLVNGEGGWAEWPVLIMWTSYVLNVRGI